MLSQEYTEMAKQIGIKDALIGFAFFTIIVLGIHFWIKKSKKSG